MNIENFLQKNNGPVYIYGAGNLGNLLYWYVKNHNLSVKKYIVTSYNSQGYYVTNGLPITDKQSFLNEKKENEVVVVAIKFQEVIKDELKGQGIGEVYCLDAADELIIAKYLFDSIFPEVRKNASVDRLHIDLLGQRFINPFFDDERFLDFFMGGVDMLFPFLCGEERFINEGPYEIQNVQLMPGDVVINCGASVGLFSQIALNRGCELHCFEPAEHQLGLLKEALSYYDKKTYKIIEKAVSDEVGIHEFFIHKSFEYDGYYKKKDCLDKIYVPTTTIDEYVNENKLKAVDFIKANIEGAERNMLMGATETLRRFAPKLSIRANHLEDDVEVITDIIKKANNKYIVEHHYKNIYAYVNN